MRIPAVCGDVQMLPVQTHIKDAHGVLQVPLEHHGVGETGPKAQKLRTLYPSQRTARRSSEPSSLGGLQGVLQADHQGGDLLSHAQLLQ